MRLLLLILISSLCLSGCSIKYKGMGVFLGTNEVFMADIDHNAIAGVANVTASNGQGVSCRGTSRVTYVPPGQMFSCAGQKGEMLLICSDGREAKIEWHAESCTSGYGSGIDSDGNRIILAFGGDEATLASRAGVPNVSRSPAQAADADFRPRFTGTGFFVTNDGLLVTNAHVVKGANKFAVKNTKTGEVHTATLLHTDKNNDVALLKVDVAAKPIPLAPRFDGKRGEEVLTLGYPRTTAQGEGQKATFGRINAPSGIRDDVRFAQVDLPIQPGNSGGPLINAQGQVVGITTSGLVGEGIQNVNYALKVDYIYPLLQMQDRKPASTAGRSGLTQTALASLYEDSVVLVMAK